jgi:hypothetical protein
VEYFRIPRNVLTICLGKSTYARCGIIVNVTPLEPEWEGHVTLEFSNTTTLPAKIYANEGVAQMLFFESDEVCEVSYKDRGGKYQGQRGVTLPQGLSRAGADFSLAGFTTGSLVRALDGPGGETRPPLRRLRYSPRGLHLPRTHTAWIQFTVFAALPSTGYPSPAAACHPASHPIFRQSPIVPAPVPPHRQRVDDVFEARHARGERSSAVSPCRIRHAGLQYRGGRRRVPA